MIINYSASMLVKKPCATLNYEFRQSLKRNKGSVASTIPYFKKEPNEQELKGDEFAIAHTTGMKEMQGMFGRVLSQDIFKSVKQEYRILKEKEINEAIIMIYYSFDEVRKIKGRLNFIEHKSVQKENWENWYFNSSAIQTAFQASLLEASAHYLTDYALHTAKYAVEEGNEKRTLDITNSEGNHLIDFGRIQNKLHFGDDYYYIKFNPFPILQFYMTKARAALSYKRSREFDEAFKHKEWEYLKAHIKYRKV